MIGFDACAETRSMGSVLLIVIVGTSLWVYFDARDRDWSHDGFANKPWKWLLGSLGLWIVVFPLYLTRRARTP